MGGAPLLGRLQTELTYDKLTGLFTWVVAKPRVYVGMVAGNLTRKGYVCIEYAGQQLKAHRLAWAFCNGAWPAAQIDHINGVRNDNRIANLREATRHENGRNKAVQCNSTTGVPGVTWRGSHQKWCARITVNGVRKHLGYFDTLLEAKCARIRAEVRYFGEFSPYTSREHHA